MIFRQLFERESSTYTYLLAARGEALLIDPVRSELAKYLKLLDELELTLVHALDTHLHADHITALGALRPPTISGPWGPSKEAIQLPRATDTFTPGDRRVALSLPARKHALHLTKSEHPPMVTLLVSIL